MNAVYCCERLQEQLTNDCPAHGPDCPDNVVIWDEEYGLALRIPGGAGGGRYLIDYCPFCGTKNR